LEEVRKIKPVWRSFHGECGVIAYVKDGKAIRSIPIPGVVMRPARDE